ncbi:PREDICTED: putative phosphatidylinositol 4-phosphate 5-kinase 11 [Prunus mume]|uniref:1-phosphatidylinositol-4-phosphate 5-kinase n=1 Tax=Prunus mume TaxID=102107 RepID=A0ABM0P1X3_PRUMU|nr:PREDICTED: putative phosphatidylinositol 4-phosphate 5-kinase 11 [Prunus mume]
MVFGSVNSPVGNPLRLSVITMTTTTKAEILELMMMMQQKPRSSMKNQTPFFSHLPRKFLEFQKGISSDKGKHMELLKEEFSPADFKATKTNCIKYSRQDFLQLPYITTDFEWKDYGPAVFRRMLELDSIDYDQYQLSICGHRTLKEVCLPGRYGRVIVSSNDNRFVIKTLRKSELKVYLEMLPNYYRHVKKYRASLLIKLYGLHVVRPAGGIKVYCAVWGNMVPSEICIDKCYDLKGSSIGRACSKTIVEDRAILKDLDFDFCFYLDPLVRARLLAQVKYDCEFLEAEGIMDYSFLLGIHIEASHEGSIDENASRSSSAKKKTDDTSEQNESSELTLADICDLLDRPGFKFGDRLPARAVRAFRNEMESKSYRSCTSAQECFKVLLIFGIVDFCQNYNMKKRIEHACKAIKYDSKSIKTVNPKAYSSRFQEFLSAVFLPEESD